MNLPEFLKIHTRRSFFRSCAGGIETLALAALLEREGLADPLTPKAPHFAPHAKNVICLFMEGAPSQMDLFDPKPALQKYAGQSLPPSMTMDLRLAFIKPTAAVLASPGKFKPYGKSGIEFSDYIPNIASCADDICLVRSIGTETRPIIIPRAIAVVHRIAQQFGRPSMGAWVVYGLGTEIAEFAGIRGC